MKALVVDDSPAMRVFIKRVLAMSGLDVETVAEAPNGQEALTMMDNDPVDLVLCDINMPVMNGEQMLTAMSASGRWKDTCVVIVSTDSTSTRVDRMFELGARGYLKKPFSPEAMRETVDRALGRTDA
jgi:two-component system, chemotaxis family, chemotaxis protein CheY